MTTDAITGIDAVEDLYLKTYSSLKAVSDTAAVDFATQVKLAGAQQGDNSASMSQSTASLDDIQDEYISTLNTINSAGKTQTGLYDSTGTVAGSLSSAALGQSTAIDTSGLTNFAAAALAGISEEDLSVLEQLQQNFRVSTSTIVNTMQELGFTFSDLAEKSNMTTLASALNGRSTQYVMPAVENVGSSVGSLYDGLGQGSGSGGGTSTGNTTEAEEEYSNIVVIGDKTYLETTTIIDGNRTVVRTEMN